MGIHHGTFWEKRGNGRFTAQLFKNDLFVCLLLFIRFVDDADHPSMGGLNETKEAMDLFSSIDFHHAAFWL